jgi:CheY-like chemotaxis protein
MSEQRGFRVLLIEDDANDATFMKVATESCDKAHTVYHVVDGVEAVQYLQGETQYANRERFPLPDLIFCDLKMPRMTGLEFLAWLKAREEFCSIPRMVYSSSCDDADVTAAYQQGATAYFVKPTGLNDLTAVLGTIYKFWTHSARPLWRRET